MDSRTPEQVFRDAIAKYSVVPANPEIEKYKMQLNEMLNEQLVLESDGHIGVTTDPLEEFDDLAMLRYGVYNTRGNITVIVSGGVHTPDERLAHVIEMFKCFEGAEFDVPFKTPKGIIMFKRDGEVIPYPLKKFINCGPCSSITLDSITFTENASITTVGANEDGTLGAGVNQKQTNEPGKLINIPDVWNNFIIRARANNVRIKNMSIDVTRYVLFPNPLKVSPQSPFYEMTQPQILNYMKVSTSMFWVSRPPAKFGLRVNEGNSIVDIQLFSEFIIDDNYNRGLDKLNEYMISAKSINLEPKYYESAAIPIMITNCAGGEYLPGVFGYGPTDKVAKQTMGCLTPESAQRVFDVIEKLDYMTPAYDPLAYLDALLN
jgi:hypothetical protein